MTEIEYKCSQPYSVTSNAAEYYAKRDAWKEEQREGIHKQVVALSNAELLQNYTQFAGGDDYDGCHSDGGSVVWEELENELHARLLAIGFLEVE